MFEKNNWCTVGKQHMFGLKICRVPVLTYGTHVDVLERSPNEPLEVSYTILGHSHSYGQSLERNRRYVEEYFSYGGGLGTLN